MELSRNEQHYYVMTIIYNLLNDYTFSSGQVKRNASEVIEEIMQMPLSEVPAYIVNVVSYVTMERLKPKSFLYSIIGLGKDYRY